MKKVVISIFIILMFIFLVGCIDYKPYTPPQEDNLEEDTSLIEEIAQIEEELAREGYDEDVESLLEEEELTEEEEIVLPELGEEEENLATEDFPVVTINENEVARLKVKISDPDQDKVTYTFSPPLNSNGTWRTSYGDAGEYIITIKANDGKLTTEKKVKLVVNKVNVPPVIEGIKDIVVREGQTVTFEPKVSDPNGDPVSTTTSEPLRSGVFITDHTSAGEYQIRVVADDGELEAEEEFTLTIQDVNVLPEIKNLQDIRVQEGEVIRIEPILVDLDEDFLTLSISEPVGDDGVWETGYTDHGTYNVLVTVNDGKDTVKKQVKVLVEDVNMPPEIIDVSLS